MSRTVNGQAYFQTSEKEVLRKMIAQVADFSGVEVLTYCVMKNHFHVLVRVIPGQVIPDSELLRRYQILYPKPTDFNQLSPSDLERVLRSESEDAAKLRSQLLARMGDVSEFMKTLKQRFSLWFNKTHDRFGPLWSDRFKSVLVEGKGFPLQTMAAYIDLNPVRAGLVDDPKDYRFCGYAEAVAGGKAALNGIYSIIGRHSQTQIHALQSYRQLLFGKGAAPVTGKSSVSRNEAIRVLEKQGGELSQCTLLRCRIRYFTEGAILGSNEFLESHMAAWQQKRERKHPSKVRPIPGNADFAAINPCRGTLYS